jgi:hypothetical protein
MGKPFFPSLSPPSPLGRRFPSYGPSGAPSPSPAPPPSRLPLSWAGWPARGPTRHLARPSRAPFFPRARPTGRLARGPAAPTTCPASVARVRAGQLPSHRRHRWGPPVGAQAAPGSSPPTPTTPAFLSPCAARPFLPHAHAKSPSRRSSSSVVRPMSRRQFGIRRGELVPVFPLPFPFSPSLLLYRARRAPTPAWPRPPPARAAGVRARRGSASARPWHGDTAHQRPARFGARAPSPCAQLGAPVMAWSPRARLRLARARFGRMARLGHGGRSSAMAPGAAPQRPTQARPGCWRAAMAPPLLRRGAQPRLARRPARAARPRHRGVACPLAS